MAYLAVNKDGMEIKCSIKPIRHNNGIISMWTTKRRGKKEDLPKGSILKLIGRELTWNDEPVEI